MNTERSKLEDKICKLGHSPTSSRFSYEVPLARGTWNVDPRDAGLRRSQLSQSAERSLLSSNFPTSMTELSPAHLKSGYVCIRILIKS